MNLMSLLSENPGISTTTSIAELEAVVRPLLKSYRDLRGMNWYLCFCEVELVDDTVQVNIYSPNPGAFIGIGGETAKSVRGFLSSALGRKCYLNAKDYQFDPYAPSYEVAPPVFVKVEDVDEVSEYPNPEWDAERQNQWEVDNWGA